MDVEREYKAALEILKGSNLGEEAKEDIIKGLNSILQGVEEGKIKEEEAMSCILHVELILIIALLD